MDSLFTAARKFGVIVIEYDEIRHAALTKGSKLFLKYAKHAMGTYEYGWEPLKPETIARKQHGDTPLIESREMIESGGYTVYQNTAIVGFTDPKIVLHEYGTSRVPPRPVLGGTVAKHGEEVAKKIGIHVGEVIEFSLAGSGVAAAISRFLGRD